MCFPPYAMIVLDGLYGLGDSKLGEVDFLGGTIIRARQIQAHFDDELRSDHCAMFTVRVGLRVTVAAIALKIWQGDRDFAMNLLDAMLNACIDCHTRKGRDTLVKVGCVSIRQLKMMGVLNAAI